MQGNQRGVGSVTFRAGSVTRGLSPFHSSEMVTDPSYDASIVFSLTSLLNGRITAGEFSDSGRGTGLDHCLSGRLLL